MIYMATPENEAKRLAAIHARWVRSPEKALFGEGTGDGPVQAMYKRVKEAKTKEELKAALDIQGFKLDKATSNDLERFVKALLEKVEPMEEREALKFSKEALLYFQISLSTKLDAMKKGYWS